MAPLLAQAVGGSRSMMPEELLSCLDLERKLTHAPKKIMKIFGR
jgi:hypothetical protein